MSRSERLAYCSRVEMDTVQLCNVKKPPVELSKTVASERAWDEAALRPARSPKPVSKLTRDANILLTCYASCRYTRDRESRTALPCRATPPSQCVLFLGACIMACMDGGSPLVGMVTRAGSACRWRPKDRRRSSTIFGSEVFRIRRAPFTPRHTHVPPVP